LVINGMADGAWLTPRRSAPIPHDITSMMDDSPYRAGRIPALNLAPAPRPARRPLASEAFSVDASWDGGERPLPACPLFRDNKFAAPRC